MILAALLAVAPSGTAGPVDLTDAELAGVTGQAGISISTEGLARITFAEFDISDTSSPLNWLKLIGVAVGDGQNGNSGYFSFAAPLENPITIDVGTNSAGRTLVSFYDTSQVSPRWYSVQDVQLCNQSLGSLNLDALSIGPSLLLFGSHANGTAGVDFDYATLVSAQAFRYTYNTSPQALTLTGIHLAGAASGVNYDPTQWAFTGNFKIGDILGGNPATIDVATVTTNGIATTSLFLNLPMSGTIRVADVNFGSVPPGTPGDFGPIAIDNIVVHHLNVRIGGL